MPPRKAKPAARGVLQVPEKSKRTAQISGIDTTKKHAPEDHAANYLAARYRLAMPLARTIAALAGLGRLA